MTEKTACGRPYGIRLLLATAIAGSLTVVGAREARDAHPLTLVAKATRSRLFGLVQLYEVALYLPSGRRSVSALGDPRIPKALHVRITYGGSIPDDIPEGWTSELAPALTEAQLRTLRRAYARLQTGDTVAIAYPRAGTTRVDVSGRVVLTDDGHRLMRGFLRIWLGRTPISEDVKRELLEELGSAARGRG